MMSKSSVTLILAGLLLLSWATGCAAQTMEELEVDHALTLEFSTPHTDWAQPYALGAIRVLFFAKGHGTEPRECVELMQRFDIEGRAVFYARIVDSSKTHWHGAENGERRMLELLEQPWACYVFLGIGLEGMSSEQKYKLLEPVTEGAGIVFVGSDDKEVLKDKNRIESLPPFLAAGPVGEAYTVGEGRGIRLPARPDISYYEGWELDYDLWQERLGRAVLWAAGKAPTSQVDLTISMPAYDWAVALDVTHPSPGRPAVLRQA